MLNLIGMPWESDIYTFFSRTVWIYFVNSWVLLVQSMTWKHKVCGVRWKHMIKAHDWHMFVHSFVLFIAPKEFCYYFAFICVILYLLCLSVCECDSCVCGASLLLKYAWCDVSSIILELHGCALRMKNAWCSLPCPESDKMLGLRSSTHCD